MRDAFPVSQENFESFAQPQEQAPTGKAKRRMPHPETSPCPEEIFPRTVDADLASPTHAAYAPEPVGVQVTDPCHCRQRSQAVRQETDSPGRPTTRLSMSAPRLPPPHTSGPGIDGESAASALPVMPEPAPSHDCREKSRNLRLHESTSEAEANTQPPAVLHPAATMRSRKTPPHCRRAQGPTHPGSQSFS